MDEFEFVDVTEQNVSDDESSEDDEIEHIEHIEQHSVIALDDLQEQMRDIQSERKKMQSEYESISGLKKQLSDEINTLAEQKISTKQLQRQMDEYASLNSKMQNEFKLLQSNRVSIEEEKTKLRLERERVKSELESLKLQRNEFETCMKKEMANLADLKKEQERNISKTKTEVEKLLIKANEANSNISAEAKWKRLDPNHAFVCKQCSTHIALDSAIESKCYQVGQGTFSEKKRGYLFTDAVNLRLGEAKTECFTTGSYSISWTFCVTCDQSLGWKYISADNETNASKVGKFCLSRHSLMQLC